MVRCSTLDSPPDAPKCVGGACDNLAVTHPNPLARKRAGDVRDNGRSAATPPRHPLARKHVGAFDNPPATPTPPRAQTRRGSVQQRLAAAPRSRRPFHAIVPTPSRTQTRRE